MDTFGRALRGRRIGGRGGAAEGGDHVAGTTVLQECKAYTANNALTLHGEETTHYKCRRSDQHDGRRQLVFSTDPCTPV